MNSSGAEASPAESIKPDNELPLWVVTAFGELALARMAIADESGDLPDLGKSGHSEIKIHPIVQHIREVRDQAIKSNLSTQISSSEAAVTSALSLLRSMDIGSLSVNPNIRYHRSVINVKDGLEPPKVSTSGVVSGKLRRGIDKILFRRSLDDRRTPEEQIDVDRIVSLKIIGQMANFEDRIREILSSDESGETKQLIESHQPGVIRKHLGELALAGKIDEGSPFHPRWSEQQDPKNIQALRKFLIKTSDKNTTGEEPENMARHIRISGINGSVRPQIIASYLGITFKQWDAQRYGQSYAGPGKVPAEVIDQINFFIKLDSEVFGYYDTQAGKDTPITALDMLIKYGAGHSWSEISVSKSHKDPIDRIKGTKEGFPQDVGNSKGSWLPIELIDKKGRRVMGKFYIPFGKDPGPIIQKQLRRKGFSIAASEESTLSPPTVKA